jgi:hypothetical protein
MRRARAARTDPKYTMPSRTPAFESANHLLGRGEPTRGLWFVGLEDAGDGGRTQADVIEWIESCAKLGHPEYLPCIDHVDYSKTYGRNGSSIRNYTSRIANRLSCARMNTWQDYRRQRLWKTGCQLFQANLYPLGKPSYKGWDLNFEKLYGFSAADRDEYKREVRRTRFKNITSLWKRSNPQAVVCFGTAAWDDFREVFEVHVQSPPDEMAEGAIHVHRPERVVLTPFFGRGMSIEKANQVAKRLLEWGVSIP